MPQVSIYIRDDDYSKWAEIEKKSEFIHNALNAKARIDSVSDKLYIDGAKPINPGLDNEQRESWDKALKSQPIKTFKGTDIFPAPIPKSYSARRKK